MVCYLACKLDLDKANDRLEWNFGQDMLNYFHIPRTLKNLILNMITSTRFNILWHGLALPTFPPCHGIRQGDPLSPYLFILCLERLSILLNEATQRKWIQPMTFQDQLRISYLFFVDDIFLFVKAKQSGCQHLKDILDNSCYWSSQIISSHKSKIFFSRNTNKRSKEII